MKARLGDIAEINTGYPFRKGITPVKNGSHVVVHARDIQNNGTIQFSDSRVNPAPAPRETHILKSGDVLFLSKMNPRAIYVEEAVPNAIPTTLFFIIRPDREVLYPGFLTWFLNQPVMQRTLKRAGQGSAIINVPKKLLVDIELTLPDQKTQKAIAELYKLSLQYAVKQEELIEKMKTLIHQVSLKALNKYQAEV